MKIDALLDSMRPAPATHELSENFFSKRRIAMNGAPLKGFTLIEMMVAVTIFAVVMLIGVGALLSLIETNRRAQAINSVMNNVNAAVETMSRSIRVGTHYHCRTSTSYVPPTTYANSTQDCALGNGIVFAFEPSDGDDSTPNDQVVYRLNDTTLERSTQGGENGSWVAVTAPEVVIEAFELYVVGSTAGDSIQPRVLFTIRGSAAIPGGTTSFTVQSSVVQRLIDI